MLMVERAWVACLLKVGIGLLIVTDISTSRKFDIVG
jgi:hypothetical protein